MSMNFYTVIIHISLSLHAIIFSLFCMCFNFFRNPQAAAGHRNEEGVAILIKNNLSVNLFKSGKSSKSMVDYRLLPRFIDDPK